MKRILPVVALLLALAVPVAATVYPGFRNVPTDSMVTIIETLQPPRPPYRVWRENTQFNIRMMRIAQDSGTPITITEGSQTGVWGKDSRHHYSKDQPWNNDGTLYKIEYNGTPSVSELILDAADDYRPLRGLTCPGRISQTSAKKLFYENRWSPVAGKANEMIGIVDTLKSGPRGVLARFNILTCQQTGWWVLGGSGAGDSLGCLACSGAGIGRGEGNISNNGRFAAIGKFDYDLVNNTTGAAGADGVADDGGAGVAPFNLLKIQLVDMDSGRVGPVQTLPISRLADSLVGHWTLSATGKYLVVKYGEGSANENFRVFEFDTLGLEFGGLKVRNYTGPVPNPTGSGATGEATGVCNRCALAKGSTTDTLLASQGWITMLSHEDVGIDKDSSGVDIVVGLPRCKGGTMANSHLDVVAVNLATGVTRPVMMETTSGSTLKNMGPDFTSLRNVYRPGWAYIGYEMDSTGSDTTITRKRYRDEVIAVKINSVAVTPTVMRFGHSHSTQHATQGTWPGERGSSTYRNQWHPVPNWTGNMVAFASNWKRSCLIGCGPGIDQRNDYVMDLRCFSPRNVVDFWAQAVDTASIIVRWTMPGEDTISYGAPRVVDLRYSTSPISASTFAAATAASPQPTITSYGKAMDYTVTGLATNTAYYFAMKISTACGSSTALVSWCAFTKTTGNGAEEVCEGITAGGNKPAPPCDGCIGAPPPD